MSVCRPHGDGRERGGREGGKGRKREREGGGGGRKRRGEIEVAGMNRDCTITSHAKNLKFKFPPNQM